jgi:hypothetical protein
MDWIYLVQYMTQCQFIVGDKHLGSITIERHRAYTSKNWLQKKKLI